MLVLRHGGDTDASQVLGPTTPFGWLLRPPGVRPPAPAGGRGRRAPRAGRPRWPCGIRPRAGTRRSPRSTRTGVSSSTTTSPRAPTPTRPSIAPTTPIPHDPAEVAAKLRNLRRPRLDLDSVYGDGPRERGCGSLRRTLPARRHGRDLGEALRRSRPSRATRAGPPAPRDRCSTQGSSRRTTSRSTSAPLRIVGTLAWIGDLRNDANLITAQLHVAYLRFHNRVVERIRAAPADFGLAGSARTRGCSTSHAGWSGGITSTSCCTTTSSA